MRGFGPARVALLPPQRARRGRVQGQVPVALRLRRRAEGEYSLSLDDHAQPVGQHLRSPRHVGLRMTLTSPACPVAGSLPGEVESKVRRVPGVRSVKVDLVWDPPWTPSRMSEAAKLQLGMDDY